MILNLKAKSNYLKCTLLEEKTHRLTRFITRLHSPHVAYGFRHQTRQEMKLERILLEEMLGNLSQDLIRNDSLRQQITYVYSPRYKHIEAKEGESSQANFHFLYPTLHQYLEFLPAGNAIPLDKELILQSPVMRSDLRTYRHLVGLSVTAYEITRESILQLMDQIRRELDRKACFFEQRNIF